MAGDMFGVRTLSAWKGGWTFITHKLHTYIFGDVKCGDVGCGHAECIISILEARLIIFKFEFYNNFYSDI
jgi:hypothetical protein